MLGLSIYAMNRLKQIQNATRPNVVRPDSMDFQSPKADGGSTVFSDPEGWSKLGRPDRSEPLVGMPAQMPPMDGAVELNKYQRSVHALVNGQREQTPRWKEQYGVWQFEHQTMQAVADFYRNAAEASGFKLVSTPQQKKDLLIRNFVNLKGNLMIRTKQMGPKVFLVLQYRYTI